MKTLYVTDLDGTLLGSDIRTSDYTNQVINDLLEKGIIFSYATARSIYTASKVTRGMNTKYPVILHNGTLICDNETGDVLVKNVFGSEVADLLQDLIDHEIYPIVYSFIDGKERFSYLPEKATRVMRDFLDTRKNDVRDRPVSSEKELFDGEIFYITCMDDPEKLTPMSEKYADTFRCLMHLEMYSGTLWLEFMPKNAFKSNALRQLKEMLGCDKVVVFGDGKNDIDMFEAADEAYAVSNAVEALKEVATEVIGSNNENAVAKWLLEHARF